MTLNINLPLLCQASHVYCRLHVLRSQCCFALGAHGMNFRPAIKGCSGSGTLQQSPPPLS
jgi:hypothetical protein